MGDPTMDVYGADFSGAGDPSKGIYFARAELQGQHLTVGEVVHCDDRLDLFRAILASRAPWGLDFPFSYSSLAFPDLGVLTWEECRRLAMSRTREEFHDFLQEVAPHCEARCTEHGGGCRRTDAAAHAWSPFKCNNPDLRSMTYAGLKLLTYLHDAGIRIYPFDAAPDHEKARLYEIYPSHSWKCVDVQRSAQRLQRFIAKFNQLGVLDVAPSEDIRADNADSADAVVACITMAAAIRMYDIESAWENRPSFASEEEWRLRRQEGIIVRLPAPARGARKRRKGGC